MQKRTEKIYLNLSKEEKKKLKIKSLEKGLSISDYIRYKTLYERQ